MSGSPPPGFGELLRRHRESAGLSQEGLAERAQISPQAISALERGARRAPYRDTVALLIGALGLGEAEGGELEAAAARARIARNSVAPPPARRSVDAVPNNIPFAAGPLVGRASEVEQLREALETRRLTTVVGAGGIGKTRTALHVVSGLESVNEQFVDGVWFVDLAPLTDGDLVLVTLGAVVGAGAVSSLDELAGALAGKATLLVIDNCEHVLPAAAALVATLLARCGRVSVLATSRTALRVADEGVFRLPALGVPPRTALSRLHAPAALRYGAIELFVRRAQASEPSFAIDDENAPAIGEIVRSLDGIALALELAAARVPTLPPRHLADRLDERFRLLTQGRRDALPRQQTLHALIDWSYGLLDATQRALFRRLSVFVGGFTVPAMEAVCACAVLSSGDAFEALAALVEDSLITTEFASGEPRYRMAESTRAFALDALQKRHELADAALRHFEYFRAVAVRCAAAYRVSGDEADLDELDGEVENLRGALAWSLERGDPAAGAELAAATRATWRHRGLTSEGITWFERLAHKLGDSDPKLLAKLWAGVAYLRVNEGNAAVALAAAQRAVEVGRSAGDAETTLEALSHYVFAAARMKNFEAATAALAEAESLAEGSDGIERLRLLEVRGHTAFLRGDYDAAVHEYERLRELRSTSGGVRNGATGTMLLAETEHARGQTERALQLLEPILAEAGPQLGLSLHANILCNLAAYQVATGDLPAAMKRAREAIELVVASEPNSPYVAIALEHLALALALNGEVTRAATLAGYCEASFTSSGFERDLTERTTHDRLTALLRSQLDEAALATLLRDGAALRVPEAVRLGI